MNPDDKPIEKATDRKHHLPSLVVAGIYIGIPAAAVGLGILGLQQLDRWVHFSDANDRCAVQEYTIQDGDTLWELANQSHGCLDLTEEYNPDIDAERLNIGDDIVSFYQVPHNSPEGLTKPEWNELRKNADKIGKIGGLHDVLESVHGADYQEDIR